MYLLDPRPYPRLTAKQKDAIYREVVLYLAFMERYRLGQQDPVTPQGEQLELFSGGTSERLNVLNVLDV
jgi:hypothetical protein